MRLRLVYEIDEDGERDLFIETKNGNSTSSRMTSSFLLSMVNKFV